ncbi:MAG TPA: DUF190 domain-containing protein [Pseudonocardiaceae bacterium]|jgi:hypothetical protein|nr:DUF190 domain-containing protein [Pseudonocardiaceae bacterium]
MMRQAGVALRVTVFVDGDIMWHHKPLYREIVHRAWKAKMAGATVMNGFEGFGAGGIVHTTRLLSMSENLPYIVVIVDFEPRIREFLPQIEELLEEGTIVIDEVEMIRYVSKAHIARPPRAR